MISDRHYPPGVLERLQETLFDMLVQMDAFFREHDITYFLDGGSCLGAVRHGLHFACRQECENQYSDTYNKTPTNCFADRNTSDSKNDPWS